jgi:heme-degrading monooxygenase HmoA
MSTTIDPAKRIAPAPTIPYEGPVTLINCFEVPEGRDDAFLDLWSQTSSYFRAQKGYRSLRFHQALSPNAQYRFVNVANWASMEQFQAAHATEQFRNLVGQPAWSEYPSRPALYRVIVEHSA